MSQALVALGWSDFFATELQNYLEPLSLEARGNLLPARVMGVDRTTFRIQTELQAESAILPGSLLHGSHKIMPVIGDWVVVQKLNEPMMRIVQVLARRSVFSRTVNAGTTQRPKPSQQVITANVDTVLIVTGLNDDFDLPRLGRYVHAVQSSGALAVIVLNKTDLVADTTAFLEGAKALAPNLAVHALSATKGLGLEALQTYFQAGETVALIGSSGVGKSTLTNQILGREIAITGDTQIASHQGKHTTTARTMYFVPSGGLLVDNPGLREIAVWQEGKADFADIEHLAAQCKFRKCTHTTEFGCEVQKAIRNKKLEPARLLEYQKSLGIKILPAKRKSSR